jgi:hypothetical protein
MFFEIAPQLRTIVYVKLLAVMLRIAMSAARSSLA